LHVVGDAEGLDEAAALVGNSRKELNQTHFLPVFAGMGLGVVAGLIPIAMPGLPVSVRLGLAGGPLVAAILLSWLGRIGRVVWYMPSGANLALRELGIVLFLACVGLKAGSRFMETLLSQDGPLWLLAGLSITVVPLLVVGSVARVLLKMNFVVLSGLIAGSMTDPPAFAFANTLMKSDAPSVSYAAVYPLTMLLRILCAHFLSCSSSSQGRKESPIITTIACFQGEHCATRERPMRRKRLPAALSLVSRAS
jgi:putative transport protein